MNSPWDITWLFKATKEEYWLKYPHANKMITLQILDCSKIKHATYIRISSICYLWLTIKVANAPQHIGNSNLTNNSGFRIKLNKY